MANLDDRIDALYQLPLDQFTPARNALAKELKNASVKELEKPNVAAWAVNQLFWQQRSVYDRLLRASERLRGEHRKLLAGKSAAIREAESAHREVLREALDAIREALQSSGQAASPATLTAAQETLESLPTADRPGRLTRPLKPAGFEALAGMSIAPSLRLVDKPAASSRDERKAAKRKEDDDQQDRATEQRLARQREKEERERKERRQQAEKELKAAESAMLRAEEAVKKAEKTLGELRAKRDEAVSEYQRARLRAHE